MIKTAITGVFLLFSVVLIAQTDSLTNNKKEVPFLRQNSPWADSVLSHMSLDEKIGQLFMVAAYSGKDEAHFDQLSTLIRDYKIGGLIFFKGNPEKQLALTNRFQQEAKAPLFIAIDGEWGLSMRLKSTVKYPRQMMLGALPNDELVYEMGKQIGEQCKRLGIHINFAPVIDVNNNAANPVINNRSFGEVKEQVARYGLAYMKGLQEKGVIACGKHFPGHGDTDMDSHKSLPTIPYDYKRLDSLELYPFKKLINEGLASIMVAHLHIPQLDSTKNRASTLSPKIVNGLLRDSLGFEGLVFTDALNMSGVSAYQEAGKVDLQALIAGNDVLLFPLDVPKAIRQIKSALNKGSITEKVIDEHCLRILRAKEWSGLNHPDTLKHQQILDDLNPYKAEVLNHQIAKQSITLVQNHNALPLKHLDSLKTVYLNIGGTKYSAFYQSMQLYSDLPMIQIPRSLGANEEKKLLKQLESFDRIIIGFHRTNNNPRRNFGITRQMIAVNELLSKRQEVITVIFGNPYVLENFGDVSETAAIVVAYEDTKYTQNAAGQVVFGGISPKGSLPVTASKQFHAGLGLTFDKVRLAHSLPEEIGVSSSQLEKVDEIAKEGIRIKAYPGCQIVAIKKGNVIYNKSFGHHTYKEQQEVKNSDIYDLASITKIAATTISLIKLQAEGKIHLDSTLTDYIPEIVDSTVYQDMVLREMLAHQAGLIPWIPFYLETLTEGFPDKKIYSKDSNAVYNHKVAGGLYISSEYEDTILKTITTTHLRRRKNYKYSDLGYYFHKRIIEKVTGQPLDEYVAENFYQPMGLSNITYHPLYKFDKERILPTENDTVFRHQVVWGDVHDPGAAMQGGVGGHAGLFSNALDLGTLMYMLINDGNYGGENYLDKETIAEFTSCQFCPRNRRGAGFDKPVRSLDGGPTCDKVSLSSFGHSGFTGTITWADPEHEIVYVFLSNRVYPNAMNWAIVKEDIRTRIQSAIYTACE